jgi:hypothetical protein
METFEQLEIAKEQWIFLAALVFCELNCDAGRFEEMLGVMRLQGLVIAACGQYTLINS